MQSVVITPKNPNELKFLSNLLHKLGITSQILSSEEMEDIGMSMLLKKVDRSKKVSKGSIIKKPTLLMQIVFLLHFCLS